MPLTRRCWRGFYDNARLIMRWLPLVFTLLSFTICITLNNSGAMAFWLLVSMVGTVMPTLAFAQLRIAGSAHSDDLSECEVRRFLEGKNPLRRGQNN
ncbi:MAG: hypothetical protein ABI767_02440 [Rhodanobacter sp.]